MFSYAGMVADRYAGADGNPGVWMDDLPGFRVRPGDLRKFEVRARILDGWGL
jgi:hypothetical protein